jgi:putative iron-dependent peroxidase
MSETQSGILAGCPRLAMYMTFTLIDAAAAKKALRALCDSADGDKTVVGLGEPLVLAIGGTIQGLRTFPSYSGSGFTVPSTQSHLWLWLRGDDRGDLMLRSQALAATLAPAFAQESVVDGFQYGASRDLTGYEDGTENPKGKKAVEAGVVAGRGDGMDGSSFVAVQQWVHDFKRFGALSPRERL